MLPNDYVINQSISRNPLYVTYTIFTLSIDSKLQFSQNWDLRSLLCTFHVCQQQFLHVVSICPFHPISQTPFSLQTRLPILRHYTPYSRMNHPFSYAFPRVSGSLTAICCVSINTASTPVLSFATFYTIFSPPATDVPKCNYYWQCCVWVHASLPRPTLPDM